MIEMKSSQEKRMNARLLLRLALLALLALVSLAACGGDAAEQAPTDGAETPAGSAAVVVQAADFLFGPARIQAPPGQTLEVHVINVGSASHTFTIDEQGIDEVLAAGEEATVSVAAPQSASLRFYCRFHAARGMEGAITVQGGGEASEGGDAGQGIAGY
jgi:plastocyanin